jgi:hypothetical protein
MASRESPGIMQAILSVPINNAIYEYLVGTIENTRELRERILNSADLTSAAATQVFNEYSAAVHQAVRNILPSLHEAALLSGSLITTIGVQIESSPLVEEIREALTSNTPPNKIFARMQQVLYLILLKKARETEPTITYDQIIRRTDLVESLANQPEVIAAIRDMLSVYYDLIYGKSPMIHEDSKAMGDDNKLGDTSGLIARAARTIETAEWTAQQNEYKNLADDVAYRIWFLNNILRQAEAASVVDPGKIDQSYLSGVEGAGSLKALKKSATDAYKEILNDDIKRIVNKYNGYIGWAISNLPIAGKFNRVRDDIGKVWEYIREQQIQTDVPYQIRALNVILDHCIDITERINNGENPLNVNKLMATNELNISVSDVQPPISVRVRAIADNTWATMREGEIDRMRDEAPGLSAAAASAGAGAGASAGGRRRRYKKTRKMKGGRRTGARRPRKTARKRRTMKRKINRRRKTRR